MMLYYRFSSEHAGSYRQCVLSSSALSLGETKQLLAAHCGLTGEYLRKIDFRIFLAGERKKRTQQQQHGAKHIIGSEAYDGHPGGAEEEDLVEVVDEHQMIHAYSHLVVQRVALVAERAGGVYVHTLAKKQLSSETWKYEEGDGQSQRLSGGIAAKMMKKKAVPPEWICGLCGGVMMQPVLVKCLGSCTQSACRSCLETALRAARGACPFCGAGFRQVIRNKRLEEIINHASLHEFDLPRPSPPALPSPCSHNSSSSAALRCSQSAGGGKAAATGIGGTVAAPGNGELGRRQEIAGRGNSKEEESSEKTDGGGGGREQSGEAGGRGSSSARPLTVRGSDGSSPSSRREGQQQQTTAETDFHHFVYLLPQKNLQLMRARDMMVVDTSSALAATLTASVPLAPDAAAAAGNSSANADSCHHCASDLNGQAGKKVETNTSDSEADLEGRDAFLVPLCASGGGTSFCIGGFVRINSHNTVEISADRVAQSVVRQWQQVADAPYTFPGDGGGAAAVVAATAGGECVGGEGKKRAGVLVYRVNWLEKYGTMPMLPTRKQPLCGLIGASRRPGAGASYAVGGGGSSNSSSDSPQGLIKRSLLSCATLEVVVAAEKYEDVTTGIRIYAQFGSRPNDPWQQQQHPATSTSSTVAVAASVAASAAISASPPAVAEAARSATQRKSMQTAAGEDLSERAAGRREPFLPPVPPPPPPPLPPAATAPSSYESRRSAVREDVNGGGVVVTSGGGVLTAAIGGGPVLSGESSAVVISGGAANPSVAGVREDMTEADGKAELHVGIPASLGPPPLDLYGKPGDEANPYLGYCAVLPFLTEEQFWHIRRMQKKAVHLCRYKRPSGIEAGGSGRSSSSTSSSSTSSRESRERRRGVPTRSYKKKRRRRVSSTESSTGSDSSSSSYYTSTDASAEQRRDRRYNHAHHQQQSACSKRSSPRPLERSSTEPDGAQRWNFATAPAVSVPKSSEAKLTRQSVGEVKKQAEEEKEVKGQTMSAEKSDTSAPQTEKSSKDVQTGKGNIIPPANARARSATGKVLPVVPPPLPVKHAGTHGSPPKKAVPNLQMKEEVSPRTPRPVKIES